MIRLFALVVVTISVLPATTFGQTRESVRVIAEKAQVRLQADPNSVVLDSVSAGTVLEVVKREGAWVIVTISTESGSADRGRVGYVSLSEVEPFSTDQTRSLSRTAQVSNISDFDADYQQRFDRAKSKRDGGKRKFWWGTALAAGGVAIGLASVGSCDIYSCSGSDAGAVVGGWTVLGGGVLQLWGLIQWISGSGDLSEIAASRPRGGTNSLISPKPQLNYSVRW